MNQRIQTLSKQLKNVVLLKSDQTISHQLDERYKDAIDIQLTTDEGAQRIDFHVKKNHQLKDPVYLFLDTDSVTSLQLCMRIDTGAHLHLIEHLYGENDTPLDYESSVSVHENTYFTYTSIADTSAQKPVKVLKKATLAQNSHVIYTTGAFYGGMSVQRTHLLLQGEHAVAKATLIALTDQEQEAAYHTQITHNAKYTEGTIEHYGVANDSSTLIFEGIGKIAKNMKQSIARQVNKGIVIGAKARLDANPLLLIDEYDVTASHAAAIGKIDEEQLYYLMSRGLSEKDARRLMINAYLAPLESALEDEHLKNYVRNLLEERTI